jgi:hypothetical protein
MVAVFTVLSCASAVTDNNRLKHIKINVFIVFGFKVFEVLKKVPEWNVQKNQNIKRE